MFEKFTDCRGNGREEESAENGVCERCGGKGDAAFASYASGSLGGGLHGHVWSGCGICLGPDFNQFGNVGVVVCVLWCRARFVVCITAIVPVGKDVKVQLNLHLLHYVCIVLIVCMLVLALYLPVGICVLTCSRLYLLEPLLLSRQPHAFIVCIVNAADIWQCGKGKGGAWGPLQLHQLIAWLA